MYNVNPILMNGMNKKLDNYELIYQFYGNFFIIKKDYKKMFMIDKLFTPKAWKLLFLKGILPKEGLNMQIDKELFNLLYDTIINEYTISK